MHRGSSTLVKNTGTVHFAAPHRQHAVQCLLALQALHNATLARRGCNHLLAQACHTWPQCHVVGRQAGAGKGNAPCNSCSGTMGLLVTVVTFTSNKRGTAGKRTRACEAMHCLYSGAHMMLIRCSTAVAQRLNGRGRRGTANSHYGSVRGCAQAKTAWVRYGSLNSSRC